MQYAGTAVALRALEMNRADAYAERVLLAGTRTGRALGEGVVALPRDTQQPAQRCDREAGLLRVDERELHSLSFAKKAAAFFRISRSIRSESFSRWSRPSSRSS